MHNRFQFDDVPAPASEPDTEWIFEGEEETPPPRPSPVYLDEPDPRFRKRARFTLFVWLSLGLLLLLGGGTGVYYFYNYIYKAPGSAGAGDGRLQPGGYLPAGQLDGLRDRYFIPAGDYSEPLRRAIRLYSEADLGQARREFENLLNTSATNQEKAVALTFLAVMDMELDRFNPARLKLDRAKSIDPQNFEVIANLAILERRASNPQAAREYAMQARRLAPNDPRLSNILGNVFSDTGDYRGAADFYKQGIENTPGDPYHYYNLAYTLLRDGKLEEALLNFNNAIERARTGDIAVRSYAYIGQIHFRRERYEAAADALLRVIEMAPGEAKYLHNLGLAYLRMGKEPQAVEYFERALRAKADDAGVYRSLASAFRNLKKTEEATRALKKALEIAPEDPATLFQLGDLHYRERELREALDIYQRIARLYPADQNGQDALLRLGLVNYDLERYADSVAAFRRVLELSPNNARALHGMGLAYAADGREDLALDAWQRALAGGSSQSPPAREDERALRLDMARMYRAKGAHEEALRQYRAALAIDKSSDDPEIHLELGKTYAAVGKKVEAVRELRGVLDGKSPSALRAQALMQLAVLFSEEGNSEDMDTARAYANQAASLAPRDPDARLVQASVLIKTESMLDRDRAIEILTALTASELPPRTAARAYNLIGLAYYKNADYERALRSFENAVRLDPANKSAYDNQRLAAAKVEGVRR